MQQFLWGALTMASFVAVLFFMRFHRDTHERLFASFAAGFALLGVHWLLLAVLADSAQEHMPFAYALRLCAFGVMLVGIADKNRS